MITHVAVQAAAVIAVVRFLAYVINDRDRFRRLLFLVILALAVAVAWWMLVDGGVHVLMHDFGTASAPAPCR